MFAPGIANWSLPIATVFGIRVRAHWSLAFLMLFVLMRHFDHGTPWWWLPILLAVPLVSVLLHEFGHSLTARAVGGDSREIVMWCFGGLAMTQVPPTPGKRFLVTAMGPVVTLVLAFAAVAAIGALPPPFADPLGFYIQAADRLGFAYPLFTAIAVSNVYLLLFNLLPCYPLDGGSMLRSALWPALGLRRAVLATIVCAYVVLALLLAYSFANGAVFLGLLAVMLLITVIQEHQALRAGYDAYHAESVDAPYGEEPSWLQRRGAERQRRRAAQQRERRAAIEAELDRLLEKVSTAGLPSLTRKERRFLDAYSKQQRDH